jgi:Tol biopolymer transport system component
VGRDNFEPAISSDGTTVTWASKALIGATAPSSFNIWTMNFNGTAKAYLTGNTAASLDSRNPKFSPDMSQITFISKMNVNAAAANSFNVWIMDQSGLNQVALTTNNAASKDCEMPEFSPDNTKIAFSSKMNVGVTVSSSYNVFVVNSSGVGSPVNVTQNTNAGLDSHAGPFNIWYAE